MLRTVVLVMASVRVNEEWCVCCAGERVCVGGILRFCIYKRSPKKDLQGAGR